MKWQLQTNPPKGGLLRCLEMLFHLRFQIVAPVGNADMLKSGPRVGWSEQDGWYVDLDVGHRAKVARIKELLQQESHIERQYQLIVFDGRALEPYTDPDMRLSDFPKLLEHCRFHNDEQPVRLTVFQTLPASDTLGRELDVVDEDEFRCNCCENWFRQPESVLELYREGYSTAMRSTEGNITLCWRCEPVVNTRPYMKYEFIKISSISQQQLTVNAPSSAPFTPPSRTRRAPSIISISSTPDSDSNYQDAPQTPEQPHRELEIPSAPRKKKRTRPMSPTPARRLNFE